MSYIYSIEGKREIERAREREMRKDREKERERNENDKREKIGENFEFIYII